MANALRWSEDQLAAHLRRAPAATAAAAAVAPALRAPAPAQAPESPLPVAVGTLREPGMNNTEAEYAGMLEARRLRGEVVWWKYEAITLKLADGTRYTPDFAVMLADGTFEIHETKGGFIREDGWLKVKVAASMFPFRFFLCQKQSKKEGGGWSVKGV